MTSPPATGVCPKAAPRPQLRGMCARQLKFEFNPSIEWVHSARTLNRSQTTGTILNTERGKGGRGNGGQDHRGPWIGLIDRELSNEPRETAAPLHPSERVQREQGSSPMIRSQETSRLP